MKTHMRMLPLALVAMLGASSAFAAAMSSAQQAIVDAFAATAGKETPGFQGFSADRGKAFFHGQHKGGKEDSPSCTSCHTSDLTKPGKSRAGKEIAPMAASVNPKRFTDTADVDKWLKRNCNDVLGRECTTTEKGDVLTYLLGL